MTLGFATKLILMALEENIIYFFTPNEIKMKYGNKENIQNKILKNADDFVHKFLSNPGTASDKFLEHLQKY